MLILQTVSDVDVQEETGSGRDPRAMLLKTQVNQLFVYPERRPIVTELDNLGGG
jgi:hypothetical protein